MSTMMHDSMKTARDGVGAVREGTARTVTSTVTSVLKAVSAVSGVVSVLRSFAPEDGLAWLGLARRRPLRSAGLFGAGVAVGAGLGVLFAPMSGRDLRRAAAERFGPKKHAGEEPSEERDSDTAAANGTHGVAAEA